MSPRPSAVALVLTDPEPEDVVGQIRPAPSINL